MHKKPPAQTNPVEPINYILTHLIKFVAQCVNQGRKPAAHSGSEAAPFSANLIVLLQKIRAVSPSLTHLLDTSPYDKPAGKRALDRKTKP